jgi:hypothetical protein
MIRLLFIVYCVGLTVLLVAPDPAALLGIEKAPGAAGGRGIHFLAFLVLGLLALGSRWRLTPGLLIGLLIAYALATESLQWLVPPRTVAAPDFAENLLGLAAAAGCWRLVRGPISPGSP